MNPLLKKLLQLQKKNPKVLVAKNPDEDFIPYVCHFDPNTILTKNGELLQIIRITGFNNSSLLSEIVSLRDTVRDAIADHVKDNKVAFWFNTIRRKKNITPKGEFKDFFAQKFNEAWVKENQWNDQYVNELYITIIVEGFDTSIVNLKSFVRSFSYLATKSLHKNFLQEEHKKLSKISADIIKETEIYGAKLLGIIEWEGVLYSEPMRFFGKIANLYEERYPLAANDISNDLTSHKIAFGNRELEVIGYQNKNFAAILSLKEYFEVSTTALDRILQLPFEFIITQSFDFTFSKKDLEHYEYQDYILQVSGDEDFRQISGVANFIESKHDLPTDYGKLQTTIMLISKSREDLERDVKSILDQFSTLGFVAVREDIFLEHCFWSQLPANFRYLRRQKLINTHRVAGFAALHNFPSGSIAGNKWGSAVTVLKTVLNTPYFFNFHEGDLGHTIVLGPKNSGKTVLINFLLTQLRKAQNKIFYFDFNNSAKCFIKALAGSYYSMSHHEIHDEEFLQLNPFLAPKNVENQNFLNDFFVSLLAFTKDEIAADELKLIPQVVDKILEANANNFATAADLFNTPETKNIYEKLKIWNGGKLGYIFGSQNEINWSDSIIAFDLTEIEQQLPVLIATVNYLLYKIESSLDQSPAVIVLNKAWQILDNRILAPKIADFLQRMKSKNCLVIFASENDGEIEKSEIGTLIKSNIATEIFMPDDNPHQSYKTVFGLTDEELEIVKMMNQSERVFLFKHGEDSVISFLNLTQLTKFLKIFSADQLTLAAMQEVIVANLSETQKVADLQIWLPQFFDVLNEIEKERIAQEKQEAREAAAKERERIRQKLENY